MPEWTSFWQWLGWFAMLCMVLFWIDMMVSSLTCDGKAQRRMVKSFTRMSRLFGRLVKRIEFLERVMDDVVNSAPDDEEEEDDPSEHWKK